MRFTATLRNALAVAASILAAEACFAQTAIQPPALQPNNRPTTSPYLFLSDPLTSPALDYYRRIRPEREFRSAYSQQSRAINTLNQEVNQLQQAPLIQSPTSALTGTGHPTSFQNYGGYFSMPPTGAGNPTMGRRGR